jgi:hypothetical protein
MKGSVLVQDKSPVKDAVVELHFIDSSSLNVIKIYDDLL